ncbi:MAG: integrase arm-type DNA-binding domain-containing protein [Betaproteobacteria bacterium]|nr:integrase arm-type DNA-binding domain-containing protein [Betaproteobacteria bacterium]
MTNGRRIDRLSPRKVATAGPGLHNDGLGLLLQVTPFGAKSWLLRYRFAGRRREMGLGPLSEVSLAEARERRERYRKQIRDGTDPIEQRRADKRARVAERAQAMTFADTAGAFIRSKSVEWTNPKHVAQWQATLETYAFPVLGEIDVRDVDVGAVLRVLEPIWCEKPETASRVRGRVEAVLGWAGARGYRSIENPARWRGHLDKLLPAPTKVRAVAHHAALPYAEISDFMQALRAQAGIGARALEFAILTAARTGEVLGATWAEIDAQRALWTVPAIRMKAGREHRVPLSAPALGVLQALHRENEYVFPGGKIGRPLSNMAMLATLRRMGRGELTAHGFRSTFRDWAAEQTHFPKELAEAALAHVVSGKTEAAYQRGDLLEKRRRMMDDWARYVEAERGEVIPFARSVKDGAA